MPIMFKARVCRCQIPGLLGKTQLLGLAGFGVDFHFAEMAAGEKLGNLRGKRCGIGTVSFDVSRYFRALKRGLDHVKQLHLPVGGGRFEHVRRDLFAFFDDLVGCDSCGRTVQHGHPRGECSAAICCKVGAVARSPNAFREDTQAVIRFTKASKISPSRNSRASTPGGSCVRARCGAPAATIDHRDR